MTNYKKLTAYHKNKTIVSEFIYSLQLSAVKTIERENLTCGTLYNVDMIAVVKSIEENEKLPQMLTELVKNNNIYRASFDFLELSCCLNKKYRKWLLSYNGKGSDFHPPFENFFEFSEMDMNRLLLKYNPSEILNSDNINIVDSYLLLNEKEHLLKRDSDMMFIPKKDNISLESFEKLKLTVNMTQNENLEKLENFKLSKRTIFSYESGLMSEIEINITKTGITTPIAEFYLYEINYGELNDVFDYLTNKTDTEKENWVEEEELAIPYLSPTRSPYKLIKEWYRDNKENMECKNPEILWSGINKVVAETFLPESIEFSKLTYSYNKNNKYLFLYKEKLNIEELTSIELYEIHKNIQNYLFYPMNTKCSNDNNIMMQPLDGKVLTIFLSNGIGNYLEYFTDKYKEKYIYALGGLVQAFGTNGKICNTYLKNNVLQKNIKIIRE